MLALKTGSFAKEFPAGWKWCSGTLRKYSAVSSEAAGKAHAACMSIDDVKTANLISGLYDAVQKKENDSAEFTLGSGTAARFLKNSYPETADVIAALCHRLSVENNLRAVMKVRECS